MLLVLTSPRFLYPGLADNDGPPDNFTVASRLALTLWDGLPDKKLLHAAGKGSLQSPEQITTQIQRMVLSNKTKRKMQGFFREWLALDEQHDLRKDPDLFPGFDERLVRDLRRSLEHFVDEVVWSDRSDYRDLLLNKNIFLNERLATFYGAEPLQGEALRKVTLSNRPNSGILTHPFLLAAHAYHDNTSPIHRGVFISRNVLGRLLKPPVEAVAFKDDEFDPALTMREKITQLTKATSCMECHRVINPVGFSLENFDAVGRHRLKDNRKPVDTVTRYVNENEREIPIGSIHDIATMAAGSRLAHEAFITHLFHHFTKQSINAYGADTKASLHAKFAKSGYNIRSLLVELTKVAVSHKAEAKPLAAK